MHTTIFAPKDKEQRQPALIDAANAVFAERGFDAATTREIAERAGCAEGLIHRYFAGKRGLLLAILEHKAPHGRPTSSRDTPRRRLRRKHEIEQILLLRHRLQVGEARLHARLRLPGRHRPRSRRRHPATASSSRQVAVIAETAAPPPARPAASAPTSTSTPSPTTISGLGFSTGFMYRVAFGGSRERSRAHRPQAAARLARGISTGTRQKENSLMKVGLQIPSSPGPAARRTSARTWPRSRKTAEDAGFDSIWVMDHFFQIPDVGAAEMDMLEAYTTLGFLAGQTKRVGLGTLVTGVTYRHPGILAKQVTTLDVLSGGRAWLGIGAAWFEREHDGLGVPLPAAEGALRAAGGGAADRHQMWN